MKYYEYVKFLCTDFNTMVYFFNQIDIIPKDKKDYGYDFLRGQMEVQKS